jgi:hypothetical protein
MRENTGWLAVDEIRSRGVKVDEWRWSESGKRSECIVINYTIMI